MKTVGLIGNPNCGKTTIFNGLTGSNQHIGNWPGVTVEKKEGFATLNSQPSTSQHSNPQTSNFPIKVVDLPGVYSLTATSEDERATLEYVLSHEADLYVNVLDATALERNLYLTLLMCELKVPMIVVVTMIDIARQRNITIEIDHLASHLGVPVIGVNANNPKDLDRLRDLLSSHLTLSQPLSSPPSEPQTSNLKPQTSNLAHLVPTVRLEYGNELEQEIDILASCTVKTAAALKVSRQWVALKALEGDPFIRRKLEEYHDMAPEVVDGAIERVTRILADPPDIELAEARYGIISGLVHDVVHVARTKIDVSEWIDRFVLNRFLGLPLFLVVMGAVFGLVSAAGGKPTEFFESAGGFVNSLAGKFLSGICHAPDWLTAVVTGGIGNALIVLFSFVPVIFCMFLCLSILEDSGYMARAAFLADRLMRGMGLPGKSFVPLLVGFGCSVPAILATRALESKRDRFLTIFMIPFMSCGAKLPVFAAFAVAFAPEAPWKMMLALYLTGIVLGTVTGFALKKTLFTGEPAHFIMELPPYHLPRPKHILRHTWERLWGFLWRAGKFIVPMMLVLGLLNTFDIHGRLASRGSAHGDTLLAQAGRVLTPVFEPIGVEKNNWPACVAVFTGLFAKESVIGTLNGLYGQDMKLQDEGQPAETDQTDNVLRRHFTKGFHQAFAYLLFILLYVPCVGATAVVFKEVGKFYGSVFVGYLTVFGWCIATLYFQITIGHSPLWIAVPVAILAAIFAAFRAIGRKKRVDMV